MTEAMPFLQKTILLSYDPRPSGGGALFQFQVDFFRRKRAYCTPSSAPVHPINAIAAG